MFWAPFFLSHLLAEHRGIARFGVKLGAPLQVRPPGDDDRCPEIPVLGSFFQDQSHCQLYSLKGGWIHGSIFDSLYFGLFG